MPHSADAVSSAGFATLGGEFSLLLYCVLFAVILRNAVALGQLCVSFWLTARAAPAKSERLELWQRVQVNPPRISVIAPAFNEALSISQSVRSLLSLQYPNLELIVVNDGSTDATIEVLKHEFGMEAHDRQTAIGLHATRVRSFLHSQHNTSLFVIDKENGRKADAINAGISYASGDLICVIDADSVIDPEGLLRAVEPFLDDDGSLIAVGGSIRIANGCDVSEGRIARIGVSKALLPRIQALEYFRAFLTARVASARYGVLLLISGAFGLYRRDHLIEVGGYRHDTVGEDLEILVRLQRRMRETGRKHRVAFLPEICCWTEAPETIEGLRNQRARWQQGALETLVRHRHIIGNPRYGRLGLIAMPLLVLEDLLGPLLELLGYVLVPVAWALGILDTQMAIGFFALTCLLGVLTSAGSLLLEEMQLRPVPSRRDVAKLLVASLIENLGYRQMIQCFRLIGCWRFLRGEKGWARVPRIGFGASARGPYPNHFPG